MQMNESEVEALVFWVLQRCPLTECDHAVAVKIAAAIAQVEAQNGQG